MCDGVIIMTRGIVIGLGGPRELLGGLLGGLEELFGVGSAERHRQMVFPIGIEQGQVLDNDVEDELLEEAAEKLLEALPVTLCHKAEPTLAEFLAPAMSGHVDPGVIDEVITDVGEQLNEEGGWNEAKDRLREFKQLFEQRVAALSQQIASFNVGIPPFIGDDETTRQASDRVKMAVHAIMADEQRKAAELHGWRIDEDRSMIFPPEELAPTHAPIQLIGSGGISLDTDGAREMAAFFEALAQRLDPTADETDGAESRETAGASA